jgi:ankyrin repeat protein
MAVSFRFFADHGAPAECRGRVIETFAAIGLAWALALGNANAATGSRGSMDKDLELIAAAERNDVPTVRRLLHDGADLRARDRQGRTALLAATAGNHIESAALLIEAGADVNAQDNQLDSPLLLAGASGYLEILKPTLKAHPDFTIYNRYGGTALIPACERGHVEVVKELLKTKIDVNHVNRLGWTALLEAIILSDGGPRHQEIVKILESARAR